MIKPVGISVAALICIIALAVPDAAPQSGIWMDGNRLRALPMSGSAWTSLKAAADRSCGTPNLVDQEDPANVCVMAKALVYARTGTASYADEVVTALRAVVNSGSYGGRALALGRELVAYVIAADLINLASYDSSLDQAFRSKIRSLSTTVTTEAGTLIQCHENRPNNWGTHCGASRAAVAAYLGDTAQLARIAQVFKGWLGDRSSYAGFNYGDLSWQSNSAAPVGVNPRSAIKSGHDVDGVLPDDQRRCGTFIWPAPRENYVWEALQGALAQAVILHRAGYDVFNWQDQALRRAVTWLHGPGGYPAEADDTWQPHLVNYFYGSSFPEPTPSRPGKNVGWTDWTHSGADAGSPPAPTPPAPTPPAPTPPAPTPPTPAPPAPAPAPPAPTSLGPAPFGQVDTPAQNAGGIVGAVGVTGWALDDAGVSKVQIYRNCLPWDACSVVGGHSVVYIGDAMFVPGARPDVEAAFPDRPLAHRAGWGYLMLTNMLPHVPRGRTYGGQGPLTLYAFAYDNDGNVTLLGRSQADHTPTAVTLANDTIAKPFGAIDTPGQGQTVNGVLANFGWALTPDANTAAGAGDVVIPADGSTMRVFIDGVAVGHVDYNQCRGSIGNPVPAGVYCDDDVSGIFGNPSPQPVGQPRAANPTPYRNLDAGGAPIGAFVIDTTRLANGLHTIAWGVTDSAGRSEGIGSRYFLVANSGADQRPTAGDRAIDTTTAVAADGAMPNTAEIVAASAAAQGDVGQLAPLAPASGEVQGRVGFDLHAPFVAVPADAAGVRHVRVAESGRLELQLGAVDAGYLVANGTLRDLPHGSQLDRAAGTFTWMPGPGYLGTYELAFVRDGGECRVSVSVTPKTAAVPGESEIRMHLDLPSTGQVLSGAFQVAGWALDPQAAIGAGVGPVHVWARRTDVATASPVFLGEAELDGRRPDVGTAFGVQFQSSGFGLTAAALEPGRYDLTAFVWNQRTARWEDARTVDVVVR